MRVTISNSLGDTLITSARVTWQAMYCRPSGHSKTHGALSIASESSEQLTISACKKPWCLPVG